MFSPRYRCNFILKTPLGDSNTVKWKSPILTGHTLMNPPLLTVTRNNRNSAIALLQHIEHIQIRLAPTCQSKQQNLQSRSFIIAFERLKVVILRCLIH
nr:hypothetical transcript [Hymenolepis microstoma]